MNSCPLLYMGDEENVNVKEIVDHRVVSRGKINELQYKTEVEGTGQFMWATHVVPSLIVQYLDSLDLRAVSDPFKTCDECYKTKCNEWFTSVVDNQFDTIRLFYLDGEDLITTKALAGRIDNSRIASIDIANFSPSLHMLVNVYRIADTWPKLVGINLLNMYSGTHLRKLSDAIKTGSDRVNAMWLDYTGSYIGKESSAFHVREKLLPRDDIEQAFKGVLSDSSILAVTYSDRGLSNKGNSGKDIRNDIICIGLKYGFKVTPLCAPDLSVCSSGSRVRSKYTRPTYSLRSKTKKGAQTTRATWKHNPKNLTPGTVVSYKFKSKEGVEKSVLGTIMKQYKQAEALYRVKFEGYAAGKMTLHPNDRDWYVYKLGIIKKELKTCTPSRIETCNTIVQYCNPKMVMHIFRITRG
jgi:hypothetical protein